MSESLNGPRQYEFAPTSLEEARDLVIGQMQKEHLVDSFGNPSPLLNPDFIPGAPDSDSSSFDDAGTVFEEGSIDPTSLKNLFAEAKEKYPDYLAGDGDRDITWDDIEEEMTSDPELAEYDLNTLLRFLVSDMVTSKLYEEDESAKE